MIDPNASAFPFVETGNPKECASPGLTIRQEFAVRAMQALATHYGPMMDGNTVYQLVIASVGLADRLISELNKPNQGTVPEK